MSKDVTRREMMKRSLVVLGAAGAAGTVLAACGNEGESFTCTDVSGLDEAQRQARTVLEYSDHSSHDDQNCFNCNLWQGGTNESQCGTCQVVQGPIHPHGWCKSWVAKQG